MDYKRVYDQIVERAKNRVLEGYKEKHHIIPRCIGGLDTEDNIVELTAREHFVCHWLLHNLQPDHRGLSLAFSMMCTMENPNQSRYTPSSRIIEYAKLIANKNSTGWKHSEEAKNKISLAGIGNKYNLGRYPTDETRKKMSETRKGRIFSEEHKAKIRNSIKDLDRPWLKMENRDPNKEQIRNQRISQAKKGKPFSEEHRKKLSEAAKNRKKRSFT